MWKVQMVTHVLFKCMLENSAEQGFGSRVVKDFSKDILGKSYHLFFDNFFFTPMLASDLLTNKTYSTATVYRQTGNICLGLNNWGKQWRGDSIFCSDSDQTTVTLKLGDGSRTTVRCPESVKLYNQYMGGVDLRTYLADQLRNAYSCSRKSTYKWYTHLFWFFLEISIINAFVLMQVILRNVYTKCICLDAGKSKSYTCLQQDTKKLAHRELFRLQLAKDLISTFTAHQATGIPSHAESIGCYTERHFPMGLDMTAACIHCSSGSKCKQTKFGCGPCGNNVHLCVTCFGPFHTR